MTPLKKFASDRLLWLLVLASLVFPSVITVIHSDATSPLDEWVFIDYTAKVFDQGYVHDGERVGELTNRIMACSGVIPGSTFGTCDLGLPGNYANLPYTGLTAAAAYTPIYFAATRILALPLRAAGLSELLSWRLTGAIWLALAMALIVAIMRRWQIPNRAILPLGLFLIASPYVWWAHTFVSTDAPSLFIGALLLYLSTRIRRGEIPGWTLVIAAAMAAAFKVTNLVSVGLVAIYLIGAWGIQIFTKHEGNLQSRRSMVNRSEFGGLVFWPLISIAAAVGVQLGWSRFIAATAIQGERANQGISSPLSLSELGLQVTNFLSSVLSYSPFTGHGHDFLFTPMAWVLIAGVIGAFFVLKRLDQRAEIVTATLVAALVMAPILAIAVQLTQGSYFQLSPRYGASLVPAFLLSVGFILRNRVAQWALTFYAGGLLAVGLAAAFMLN